MQCGTSVTEAHTETNRGDRQQSRTSKQVLCKRFFTLWRSSGDGRSDQSKEQAQEFVLAGAGALAIDF